MAESLITCGSLKMSDIGSGNEDIECIICLEQTILHTLPCTHKYCHKCLGEISAGKTQLECPVCRNVTAVPTEGFSVCLPQSPLQSSGDGQGKATPVDQKQVDTPLKDADITFSLIDLEQSIRDNSPGAVMPAVEATEKVEDNRSKGATATSDIAAEPPERMISSEYRCHSSDCKSKVEAHCVKCSYFYCYRCSAVQRDCTGQGTQHLVEPMQDTVTKTLSKLTLCQQNINTQVEGARQQLTHLCSEKEKLLVMINEKITQKQAEIDNKLSLITASQIIENESDAVQLYRQANNFLSSVSKDSADRRATSTKSAAGAATGQTRPPKGKLSTKDLQKVPTALKCIQPRLAARSQAMCVHHHSATGQLLIGCFKGLKVYDKQSGEVKDLLARAAVIVTEHNREVFICFKETAMAKVAKYNMADNTITQILFTFPMKSNSAAYVTVSDRYIAVNDRDNRNCLKLYRRQQESLQPQQLKSTFFRSVLNSLTKSTTSVVTSIKLPQFTVIFNIHFLPDGSLLATGSGAVKHRLCKYLMPEDPAHEPILVWSNDDLYLPFGLELTPSGLIICSSAMRKTIYILNNQGEKVKELRHDSLPDYYEQISVHGDELAVAGWHSESALLYKIQ